MVIAKKCNTKLITDDVRIFQGTQIQLLKRYDHYEAENYKENRYKS